MSTCFSACTTCSLPSVFYACTSCTSPLQLYSNTCLQTTNYGIQLASTLSLLIFVIPHLLHIRRLLTLTLLFDLVQVVHYFKLLTVYDSSRNVYLMLGGRGWGDWSEGWNLVGAGQGAGIWVTEEGNVDKAIRIIIYFSGVMALTLILSLIKIVTGQQGVTFTMFWKKNWLNSIMLGVYINIQDMSFIVANRFYLQSSTISSASSNPIDIVIAAIFVLIIIAFVVTLTYVINTMPFNNPNEYFYHANIFVFSFESGEYFPTYYSIENPQEKDNSVVSEEDVNIPKPRKSNMRLACVLMKIIYPFITVATLYGGSDQILQIAAFLVFWAVILWSSLPYSPRQEWSQMVLLIIAQILSIALLFIKSILTPTITMAFMFCFIGFGLSSLLIELFYSYYKLLPVDLYNTGMKIDIHVTDPALQRQKRMLQQEKKRLEEELRRQEQQNKKRMEMMNDADRKLEAERLKKQLELQREIERLRREMQGESDRNKKKLLEEQQNALKDKQDSIMTEDESMLQAKRQEILRKIRDKYKVDASKLNPYEWDKKRKFVYSNIMTDK